MEKRRILAVDDNSISLATIEQELKREYEVIPVNSGERALQYLRRERPDLILMDIQMAQKSGIETLREIRGMEKCKDIPVIMITSKHIRMLRFMTRTGSWCGAGRIRKHFCGLMSTRGRCASM